MKVFMINHANRVQTSLSAALMCAAFSTLNACEKPKAAGLPQQDPTVSTAVVTTRDIPMAREFPATIASPQMVDINARVPGWLLDQVTVDGARVSKGQLLYNIDPSQYKIALDAAGAQLAQATAQVAVAKAQLDTATAQKTFAQSTFDRNQPLVATGAVSKEKFDSYTANLAEAIAAVEQATANIALAQATELSAKASVANAQLNLSYCTIVSPLDGLMGVSNYFEGSLVGDASKQLLNTVVQMDPMWASFSPSANFLPNFVANLAAGPLPAKVTLAGASAAPVAGMPLSLGVNSPTAQGRLVMVDNKVSGTSDTILMRVEFPNPSSVFRPGAYVTVTVELGMEKGATVIPTSAAFARQTELFVWRVKSDDTVESIAIDVISAYGDELVLRSGVTPGDRIVTEGVGKLRVGMKVKIAPPTTFGAAPAAPTTTTTATTTPAAAASGKN